MAIDPEISLGVRPPVFNVESATPFQQAGQILNLQGLMQQSQLRNVQMQNVAAEMADRQYKLQNIQKFQGLYQPGQPDPTPTDIYRTLGPDGTRVVQEMIANEKERVANKNAIDLRNGNRASTILNQPDNDFIFHSQIQDALQAGDIPQTVASDLMNRSIKDPQTQALLRGYRDNAMNATQQQTYYQTDLENKHKNVTNALDEGEKTQDLIKKELETAGQTVGNVSDVKGIPDWLKTLGPNAQKIYANLPALAAAGVPLETIKNTVQIGGAKPEVGKTVPLPASVVEQQITTEQGKELAKRAAEMQAFQPVVSRVLTGEQKFQDLPTDVQNKIAPGLIASGYQGFGKYLSDAERGRLADMDKALTILKGTQTKLQNKDTRGMMGVLGGTVTQIPWATEHKDLQSDLLTQQQELKKFITNGSLRGLNADTLNQMFPNIWSQPEHADHQVQNLIDTVQNERQQYLNDLAGKVVPEALRTPGGGPAPAAAPTAGTFPQSPVTIQGGIPGKVHVRRPDGQTGYINASAFPSMQKQGYTQIP
jgi:hypothetical protein